MTDQDDDSMDETENSFVEDIADDLEQARQKPDIPSPTEDLDDE